MEGYREVEIKNPINNSVMTVIKSCNHCDYKKDIIGHIDYTICSLVKNDMEPHIIHLNVYGYYEAHIHCPFNDKIQRNKKLKSILKNDI